jgi:subtilisin family serine protease
MIQNDMRKAILLSLLFAIEGGAVENSLKGLLVLPAALSPGEEVELEPLDPKRTPPGGQWTVAGVRAVESDGRLGVRLPANLKNGDPIAVSYRDRQGQRIVDVPEVKGVRVLPPVDAARPRLGGCAPRGVIGDIVCVCGYFPRSAWNGLALDGKPAGRPVAGSSRAVHLRLPAGTLPGAHIVSGSPSLGFSASDQLILEAIEVHGEIDRNALLRGQKTALHIQVNGTRDKLPFRISNHSRGIIRMEGGDDQTVYSAGGPRNSLQRGVRALRRGDFQVTYELDTDPCPCTSQEPRPRDPRGFIPARVLALIALGPAQAMLATAQALAATHALVVAEVAALPSTNDGLVVFTIPDATDVLIKVAALTADPRVRSAQPDYLYETTAAELSFGRKLMHLDRVDTSLTGSGVTVAVIDSGVDPARSAERVDMTGTGVTADIHGTLMAGVILEVAPRARILSVKACIPVSAESIQGTCASSALAKALDLAIQKRARVLNLSISGPKDTLMPRLIDAAVTGGSIVVAAAGNDGAKGAPGFPAALDNVIAVTAVDAREEIYSYATRGGFIDIASPGVDIQGTTPKSQLLIFSGTSPAAAYASGVAALMLQHSPGLTSPVLQALLEQSAKDLGPAGKDPQFGSGLVDGCRAMLQLIGGARLCR